MAHFLFDSLSYSWKFLSSFTLSNNSFSSSIFLFSISAIAGTLSSILVLNSSNVFSNFYFSYVVKLSSFSRCKIRYYRLVLSRYNSATFTEWFILGLVYISNWSSFTCKANLFFSNSSYFNASNSLLNLRVRCCKRSSVEFSCPWNATNKFYCKI